MKKEIYIDDEAEEIEAKDEQHTMAEIAAIVASENKIHLEFKDPIMILITLCRIMQKEARRDMRRSLNH